MAHHHLHCSRFLAPARDRRLTNHDLNSSVWALVGKRGAKTKLAFRPDGAVPNTRHPSKDGSEASKSAELGSANSLARLMSLAETEDQA